MTGLSLSAGRDMENTGHLITGMSHVTAEGCRYDL